MEHHKISEMEGSRLEESRKFWKVVKFLLTNKYPPNMISLEGTVEKWKLDKKKLTFKISEDEHTRNYWLKLIYKFPLVVNGDIIRIQAKCFDEEGYGLPAKIISITLIKAYQSA